MTNKKFFPHTTTYFPRVIAASAVADFLRAFLTSWEDIWNVLLGQSNSTKRRIRETPSCKLSSQPLESYEGERIFSSDVMK